MRNLGAQVMQTLKCGIIDGPTLYGTQKVVAAVDMAAANVAGTKLPQELRTPLVGVVLALVPALAAGDKGYAGKVSEYFLASAVAQTLALAGNGGTGQPGVIDAAVNKMLAPVASIGMQGYLQQGQAGYLPLAGGRPNLRSGANGYVNLHN